MEINWYPGHMTKSVRMMQEDVKLVDLVIELADARIPVSSRNPDISALSPGKSQLLVLNKADLSDETENRRWMAYYKASSLPAVFMDARERSDAKALLPLALEACREKIEKDKKRGMKERPIRAMIAGIPNVGKSTFINSFSGKAMARTGNRPGVTRGKQWIRIGGRLELMDTPGILWPKLGSPQTGENLALIGSINEDILNEEELAVCLIRKLCAKYPGRLAERYHIAETDEPFNILLEAGKKRGCLVKGGEVDTARTSGILLEEFRQGKLGRITLESPEEI